jgi:hypothetical protein
MPGSRRSSSPTGGGFGHPDQPPGWGDFPPGWPAPDDPTAPEPGGGGRPFPTSKFFVEVSPTRLVVLAGGSVRYTVMAKAERGFSGPALTLSVVPLEPDLYFHGRVEFGHDTLSPRPSRPDRTTLTITLDSSTPRRRFTFFVFANQRREPHEFLESGVGDLLVVTRRHFDPPRAPNVL